MSDYLNLTPERSKPSVWDQRSGPNPGQVAAVLAGVMLMGSAGALESRKRWILQTAGVAAVAIGLFGPRISRQLEHVRDTARSRRLQQVPDPLDEALKQSFPASDPPSTP